MVEYVMVPVPEEFTDEVARYLQWAVNAAGQPRLDLDKTSQGLLALDEPCRALLVFVAESVLRGDAAAIPQVQSMLGCSEREALGTLLTVNHAMHIAGAPVALVPMKVPGATGKGFSEQIIAMSKDAARAVVDAQRQHLAESS
jgi:hypothetical protein